MLKKLFRVVIAICVVIGVTGLFTAGASSQGEVKIKEFTGDMKEYQKQWTRQVSQQDKEEIAKKSFTEWSYFQGFVNEAMRYETDEITLRPDGLYQMVQKNDMVLVCSGDPRKPGYKVVNIGLITRQTDLGPNFSDD